MCTENMDSSKNSPRSKFSRSIIGFFWFVAIYLCLFFALVEFSWWYSHYIASGEDAILLDRVISKKLGSTIGLYGFFVIGIIVAIFSFKGRLPGTAK